MTKRLHERNGDHRGALQATLRAALMAGAARGLGLALLLPGMAALPTLAAAAPTELAVSTIPADTPRTQAGMGTGDGLGPDDGGMAPVATHATPARPDDVLEAPLTQDPGPGAGHDEPATPASQATTPAPALAAPAPSAAPSPAGEPAPAVAVQPAEDPVAQSLAALLSGPDLSRYLPVKAEQEAVIAFYAGRADRPVFTAGGALSPVGTAVMAQLATAAQDGLTPSDYAVATPAAGAAPAALADAELRIAAATLLYARHLQTGRFRPGRISDDVDPLLTPPDPAAVLAAVAAGPDARAALAAHAPQYPGYAALKAKLAELRGQQDGPPTLQVPSGPVLRPNMRDARVPLLRARLGVKGDPADLVYGAELVDAVKAMQEKLGQTPNGIVGKGLIAALNGTGEQRINLIISNMERWRWLPHDVAPNYVFVNIPEFLVRIYKDGNVVHQTRVVVGKPENPTPLLSHDMEYLVVNPSWNVPPGIARKEYLPRLAGDPYFLARQGIDVVRNGKVVDPGAVDWSRGTQGYSFRQPPGERNALGKIKFMFPNKHSVYLHDTPSRALFAQDRRAFSHGCVRVFEPLKFAEVIFELGMPADTWNEARISKLLGGSERYVNLKQRFPVHLAYFNAWVNEAGALVTREDIYGIDAQTQSMLGLEGARQVADRGSKTVRP
ncbi:L,D-transpeptidase family protein [Ancylobacter lacus]|uniref:L,D-transpeptidase family protein n=1 Tax=Ancylobacter lacus TaxID=2579970 RepID=UPI001FEBB976|nr:L,D-transpeptidase family protein [Ancylobacter lacus]